MPQHRVYLRLLEKIPSNISVQERLSIVLNTINKIGPIEWVDLSIHPHGGVTAIFYVTEKPDYDQIIELIDREGWICVI